MSTLRELQRGFQAYVLDGDATVAARVAGSAAGSAQERLAIYANAVELRFQEVLGEEFPGVHTLLGDEAFARLAREYAARHPSRHPSIRWFGRHLPSFLAATPPWDAQPVLAQMCTFEWCKSELVDAADSTVVDIAQIAAIAPQDWGAMAPRMVSALRRVALDFNVPQVWQAIERGEATPQIVRLDALQAWMMWRQGTAIRWRSIDADEAWALDACAGAASFADLCEGLCRWHGEDGAPLRAAGLLKQWVSDEVLAAI